MKQKYFHELSTEERKKIHDSGHTFGWLKKHYKQPAWCNYPDALDPLGCWSLLVFDEWNGRVKSKDDCLNCELCKESTHEQGTL